jgi:uncharacterized protein (DUF2345 family)
VFDGPLTVAGRDEVAIASEADRLVLSAATEIVLQVGKSTFTLRADGTILLNGRRMTLSAPAGIHLNPEFGPRESGPDARGADAPER